jgi:hypothetical protein
MTPDRIEDDAIAITVTGFYGERANLRKRLEQFGFDIRADYDESESYDGGVMDTHIAEVDGIGCPETVQELHDEIRKACNDIPTLTIRIAGFIRGDEWEQENGRITRKPRLRNLGDDWKPSAE